MREWIRARPASPAGASYHPTEADLREAYARGRRDERARRRRAPAVMLTVSLMALAGAGVLAASAWQGAAAGLGVDDHIANLTLKAEPRLREAAVEARGVLTHGFRVRSGDDARARAHSQIGG